MRTKRVGVIVVAGLTLGVGGIWVVGALLPKGHRASVSIQLDAPPDDIWRIVRDVGSSAAWREGIREVRLLPDRPVETYAEFSGFGVINYVVESERAPDRFVMRIVDNDEFGGTWTYEIVASAGGDSAKLTITEDGEIYKPLFRFFARFLFGYSGTLEAYVRDLDTVVKTRFPRGSPTI